MRSLSVQSTRWIVAAAASALSCVVQSDPGGNQSGNSTMAVGGNSGVVSNAGSSSGGAGGNTTGQGMTTGGAANESDAGSMMQPASGGHTAGGGRPSMNSGGAGPVSMGGSSAGSGGTMNEGGGAGTSAGGCAEPAAMMGMTAAHNAVRAMVDPPNQVPLPPLHWSCDVAAVAQAYADHLAQTNNCDLVHSMGQYGENLFWSKGFDPTPQDVVDGWASEEPCYTYDVFPDQCVEVPNVCSVCGHYTQMVWRNTSVVGCGRALCGDAQVWVCNYDPPGNYINQYPY